MGARSLSADQIGDVGRQLYGERWQSPLASALGVNPRLLRYWLSGELTPSPEDERRLLALLEYAAVETARRARALVGSRQPAVSLELWSFEPEDLEIVNRQVVRHRRTGSEIAFYDYPTPPPAGDVAGGTVSNLGNLDSADLVRFQVAAWGEMALFRYGRRTDPDSAAFGEALAERRRRLGFSRVTITGWIPVSVSMVADVEEGRTSISDWYAQRLDQLEEFQRNSPDLFLSARSKILASYPREVMQAHVNDATRQPAAELVENKPGGPERAR
jgi:ribosome-binding protein aMBF1 (putative translation factor)